MGVSKNNGTPKSSILTGFSLINHPFWGTPIFGNTHISSTEILDLRVSVAFFVSSDLTNPLRRSANPPALRAATSLGSWLFEVDPRELRPEEREAY